MARLEELTPGARRLPVNHISIRVPWHDRAWDGAVCDDPQANTSCLILPRIAEEKDDAAEQVVAAKFWRELPEQQDEKLRFAVMPLIAAVVGAPGKADQDRT